MVNRVKAGSIAVLVIIAFILGTGIGVSFTPTENNVTTVSTHHIKLGSVDADPDTSSWTQAMNGTVWYNRVAGYFNYWDGTKVVSLVPSTVTRTVTTFFGFSQSSNHKYTSAVYHDGKIFYTYSDGHLGIIYVNNKTEIDKGAFADTTVRNGLCYGDNHVYGLQDNTIYEYNMSNDTIVTHSAVLPGNYDNIVWNTQNNSIMACNATSICEVDPTTWINITHTGLTFAGDTVSAHAWDSNRNRVIGIDFCWDDDVYYYYPNNNTTVKHDLNGLSSANYQGMTYPSAVYSPSRDCVYLVSGGTLNMPQSMILKINMTTSDWESIGNIPDGNVYALGNCIDDSGHVIYSVGGLYHIENNLETYAYLIYKTTGW